jgi:hypothetical protein
MNPISRAMGRLASVSGAVVVCSPLLIQLPPSPTRAATSERKLESPRGWSAKNELAPKACIPRSQCCRICKANSACGSWCSKAVINCQKARGCACNESQLCH